MTPERRTNIEADCKHAELESPTWATDAVVAHYRELLAALDASERELKLWKPLTPEEAERAYEQAEAVPLSTDEIAAIVKRATDPSERITNSEQMQLAVRVKEMEAVLTAVERERDELRAALVGMKRITSQFGKPCWCDTIAGMYCVGQPQCKAASALLAKQEGK